MCRLASENDIEENDSYVTTTQKQPERSEESNTGKTSPVTTGTPEELKTPEEINKNANVEENLEENVSAIKEVSSLQRGQETTAIEINIQTPVKDTGKSEEKEIIEDVDSEKLFSDSTSTKLPEPEIFTTELPNTSLTNTVTPETTEAGNVDEEDGENRTTPPFLFTLLKQKFSNP